MLILLLFVLLAGSARRRAASSIQLAAPTFVLLDADAASQLASDLGAAWAELLDVERRRGDD